MNITAKHYQKILKIINQINEHDNEQEMRADIAEPLIDLLDADYFASFCWQPDRQDYGKGVYMNMSDQNIERYIHYYQFKDPITSLLAKRKQATAVSEILPHNDLTKTEFFNDFLLVDGLFRGINLHLYNFDEHIGDFRIWRKKGKADFDSASSMMLNVLMPHLKQSLLNMRRYQTPTDTPMEIILDKQCHHLKYHYKLTPREIQVARLVLAGETDDYISSQLNISSTTVRTHIKHIFQKTEVCNRHKLQQLIYISPDTK